MKVAAIALAALVLSYPTHAVPQGLVPTMES